MNRKVARVAGCAVALGVALLSAGVVGQTTETLRLSGEVRAITELQVEPAAEAERLDLSTVGEQTVTVGVIHALSNVPGGYKIELTSENAGRSGDGRPHLKHTDSESRINYTILWEGQAVAMGTDGKSVVSDVNTTTPATGTARTLQVRYQGAGNPESGQTLDPGIYSDILTFHIAAK